MNAEHRRAREAVWREGKRTRLENSIESLTEHARWNRPVDGWRIGMKCRWRRVDRIGEENAMRRMTGWRQRKEGRMEDWR